MNHPASHHRLRPVIALFLLLSALLVSAVGIILASSTGDPLNEVPPPRIAPDLHGALGVNVDLTQYTPAQRATHLQALREAGFTWLRLRLTWEQIEPQEGQFLWQTWDAIIHEAHDSGFDLLLVLDGSPAWARRSEDADSPFAPPAEPAIYGEFVREAVYRYAKDVSAFQIWDEPNIAPHWGTHPISPSEYLALLREGAIAVRTAAPQAWVVLAGLAPNVEAGGDNMSDLLFLEQLYQQGGAEWFDVVAAKPYGFSEGVAVDPDPNRLNFARPLLLRQIVERYGDASTPIWAVEFGWNTFPLEESIWGSVSEEEQARFAQEAVQRARREWPWLGLLAWADYQPNLPDQHPRWGFALIDAAGLPNRVYDALSQTQRASPIAGPGRYPPDFPAATYEGEWRISSQGADIGESGDRVHFQFNGTRIDLRLRRMPYPAILYATVDGRPVNALPRDTQNRSYVMLYGPERTVAEVTIAAGLPDAVHELELVAEGGWGEWALVEFIVAREPHPSPTRFWPIPAIIFAMAGLMLLVMSQRRDWRDLDGRLRQWSGPWRRLPSTVQTAAVIVVALAFVLSPWLPLDLLSLALLGLLLLGRPDLGLPLVAAWLPFFLHAKSLAGRPLSLVELGLWLTIGAHLVRFLWRSITVEPPSLPRPYLRPLDVPLAAFLLAAVIATAFAQEQGVAFHEFRLVLLEGVLFCVVIGRGCNRGPWPLVNGWTLGGVAVSLLALYQAATLQDVAFAEGVGRVRALYGSANNLALYLDRLLPVLIAVVAFGTTSRRRRLFGMAAIPVVVASFLTFSRGAWLLGIPAAILFMGLVRGRRAFIAALSTLALAGVSLLPFLGTERFAHLFDPRQGTTFFRLRLWRSTLNMIHDHPLFGVGPDNFLYAYRTRYVMPDAWQEINLSHPHNLILDLWTRIGGLGLLAGLWLMTSAARLGWRLYRRLPEGDDRALTLGLLASLVATVAHGMIDNSIFLTDLMFVFMMTLGLLARLHDQTCRPTIGPEHKEETCASS